MPKILDECVKAVQAKIDAGELPKGSNAWAICNKSLKKPKKIKKSKKKTLIAAEQRADEMRTQLA